MIDFVDKSRLGSLHVTIVQQFPIGSIAGFRVVAANDSVH
jgi:hypothetical protein